MINFYRIRSAKKQRRAIFQTEANILHRMRLIAGYLLILIFLHVLAMMYFERLSIEDAIWLSVTTISTVGYGDLSATTVYGRVSTTLLLYVLGIVILAQLVSDYVDYRLAKRERITNGQWSWNMADHILILNAPIYNAEQYFVRLITQIRENQEYADIPIEILTTEFKDGLPHRLRELGVVYYNGSPNSSDDLDQVNIEDARHILVLAKHEYASGADSTTFDVAHRLMERNVIHKSHVECVLDENRARLRSLGVRSLLRPIRSYPEIIVRTLVAPGSETLLEDYFTHRGNHPIRYEIIIHGKLWSEVVCALILQDLGTAMAYIGEDGQVIPHPQSDQLIDATALIVMVSAESIPELEQIENAMASGSVLSN